MTVTRMFAIAAMLLTLVACNDDDVAKTYTASGDSKSVISGIVDYGVIDGCRLKYVYTREHDDFWFVRCESGTVATRYKHTQQAGKTVIDHHVSVVGDMEQPHDR